MEFFFALIVFAILGFAVVGFVATLIWFTSDKTPRQPKIPQPTLTGDVLAARRLIDHLRGNKQINEKAYQQLRGFLDRNFSEQFEAQTRPQVTAPTAQRTTAKSPVPPIVSRSPATPPSQPTEAITTQSHPTETPPPRREGVTSDLSRSVATPISPDDSIVVAEAIVVGPSDATTPKDAGQIVSDAPTPAAPPVQIPGTRPAPWDLPDPPTPQPRRSFAELMSGFMQEKNMRWGELTSGILIVLSAVGLVVSLRDELRNTIPYFSSLLFLLITGAIHGAGIYTLKKWKLRNTSRGTLVIGLLLVPLNFVAACILSGGDERRALSDPWLWTAIIVGLTGFIGMTWWSSKCLLRRGSWPMVVAVIGCGIGTLLLNRVIETTDSGLQYLLYSLPIAGCFIVGTCLFDPREFVRQRWTERATNRLYLFLGVSTFAAIASLSMAVVRADSKLAGLVAITPVASLVCVVASWLGSIVRRGSEGQSKTSLRFSGQTVEILGLILLAISLFLSIRNPTILVVNALVSALGLMVMFVHQRNEKMLPIAWAVFASGILAALNLVTGKLPFDGWASIEQLQVAIVNGKSGLCLLGVGLVVIGIHKSIQDRWTQSSARKSFVLSGWIAGGAIFLIGCVIALVASFVNRDNRFDVMTASGLILLAAIGSLVVCAVVSRKRVKYVQYLPHVVAVLWLGGLSHCLIWNPTIANGFDSFTNEIGAGWVAVAAIHGFIMAGMAALMAATAVEVFKKTIVLSFGTWSSVTNVMVWVGVFMMIGFQTGWATFFTGLACISWFLNSWAFQRSEESEKRDLVSSLFLFSTAVLVVVFIAEVVSRLSWCPTFDFPDHWLIQLIGLSIWSVAWTVLAVALEKAKFLDWLFRHKPRVDQAILFSLVIVVSVLVCLQVGLGCGQELVASFAASGPLAFHGDATWMFAALGSIGVAVVAMIIVKPTVFNGTAMVCVWMLAWAFGADCFDATRSVGSAVRWLLPIGGAIAAVLVAVRGRMLPVWAAGRSSLGLSGPSRWKGQTTQTLINLALSIVCFVVLLISSVTVSRVLIHGGEALGGPAFGSWFQRLPAEVSYAVPIAIVVATFLLYAISESRTWLATVGSAVFQYVVVLAIVLLFLSPHPKLASTWFVGILQAVSLGMSTYGFVWFWQRARIEKTASPVAAEPASGFRARRPSQIEVHTLINGLLITSLAVLAMGRFYFVPDQPGDWISSVGSWMGMTAWALFGGLAFCIWSRNLVKIRSLATWLWLAGWMGLMLTGLLAAVVDQLFAEPADFVPWLPFKVVAIGAVVVAIGQTVLLWLYGGPRAPQTDSVIKGLNANADRAVWVAWPVLLSSAVGLTFACRGALYNIGEFWLYFALIGVTVVLITILGMTLRSATLGFAACAVGLIGVTVVFWKDPQNWFTGTEPYWLNLVTIMSALLALAWTAFYVQRRRVLHEPIRRGFVSMPNVVLLAGSIWIAIAALLQLPADSGVFGTASTLANPLGFLAFVLIAGLSGAAIWIDRARFKVVSWCLLSLALIVTVISIFSTTESWRFVGADLGAALVVCGWGLAWLRRKRLVQLAKQFGATRLVALERSIQFQLPIYSTIVGSLILWAALVAIAFVDTRPHRYLAAIIPFALAVGLGCQSNPSIRRWLQIVSLSLATIGGLFLAWADLTPEQMFEVPLLSLLVRSLIVLAGAMFVYGGLVTRWVRPGDTWLKSLREMAVVTCGLAVSCFALVILAEQGSFVEGQGCGLALAESIVVALLVLGMIAGLIMIAIRPENDPFALSLQGRMGYVYAAELVMAALVAHLYFTMPWLFQLGIKEYWPYIAMAICFGGVGLAQVLEKRKLKVLGQPLFHTAAILPIVVSAAMFGIESSADASMVMLVVGMIYLMISYTHHSVISGVASVVFGNLALWMFINRFPGFSFLDHPQLWLIPPAVSALIAGQLSRKSLTGNQLAALRYICVAVIYVSSTSEIFISGIGDQLWPPIVLAILAVSGIMAGIMLHVKSFLYFGSLFLLMAMITMVSHAHQRLDHVWPWWAFGIGLGIAILVMFGLFEKRKNDMKAIAEGLRKWDA